MKVQKGVGSGRVSTLARGNCHIHLMKFCSSRSSLNDCFVYTPRLPKERKLKRSVTTKMRDGSRVQGTCNCSLNSITARQLRQGIIL